MNEGMTSDQITQVFSALGRIEQKIDSHVDTVDKHMQHDQDVQKILFDRIEALQLSHARQRGFITAIASVASAVAAGLGYAIERWLGHN